MQSKSIIQSNGFELDLVLKTDLKYLPIISAFPEESSTMLSSDLSMPDKGD